jgi:hypothetical protein
MAMPMPYEYRYFQVVSPESSLIFLTSTPVPKRWLDYLDRDREIGAAWRSDDGFELTTRARRALGIYNLAPGRHPFLAWPRFPWPLGVQTSTIALMPRHRGIKVAAASNSHRRR